MYRVGLTGNIASGKSAVADEWARLGATVIDADVLARRAVEPGSGALARIAAEFGADVVHDGVLDRAALGHVVFHDADKRRALEAIVHPEVQRLREREEAVAAARGATVVVHSIPLLFEAGLAAQFDAIVVVDASEDVRLDRLVSKRGLAPALARAMIDAQRPAAGKRRQADYVIDNSGTLEALTERARSVWQQITAAAP